MAAHHGQTAYPFRSRSHMEVSRRFFFLRSGSRFMMTSGVGLQSQAGGAGRDKMRRRWRPRQPGTASFVLPADGDEDLSSAFRSARAEHYDKGGVPNPRLDPELRILELDDRQKRALIAFLESLTGSS